MTTKTRGWWNTDPQTMDDETLFSAYRDSRDAWHLGTNNLVGGPEQHNGAREGRTNAAILQEMIVRLNAGRFTETQMLARMRGER